MDAQTVLKAMSEICDDFVAEAAPQEKKRRRFGWKAWAAVAASLVLLVGGVLYAAGAFRPRTLERVIAYRNRNHGPIAMGAYFITCVVENRAAEYEMIYTLDSADVEPFVGEPERS